MRYQLELGFVEFISRAIRQRDGLSSADKLPIAVLAGTGDLVVDEFDAAIIVLCENQPHLTGGLGLAEVNVLISSPQASGIREVHNEWQAFLDRLFVPAVAPALPANAGALAAAVRDVSDIECRGYHKRGTEGSAADGRFIENILLTVGVADQAVCDEPLTGPIVL